MVGLFPAWNMKSVFLLCRKSQEDGPCNYWKSAICLLSFNLTHVNLPCAMDTIRGCDFREGMVHLVYANAALKEDDWQLFPGTECSRYAGSWLLTSLDTKDLCVKHAVKVMEADIISRSRQAGSGNVVAEQVSQSSAVCNVRWLTWRKKGSPLVDGQWFFVDSSNLWNLQRHLKMCLTAEVIQRGHKNEEWSSVQLQPHFLSWKWCFCSDLAVPELHFKIIKRQSHLFFLFKVQKHTAKYVVLHICLLNLYLEIFSLYFSFPLWDFRLLMWRKWAVCLYIVWIAE